MLDYSRLVHGEQQFVYQRPIQAGDVLQVRTTLDSIRSVAGNDILTTRGEISTVDGELVVNRHLDAGAARRGTTGGLVTVSLAEVTVGMTLPSQTFPIERATLVRYAGASGDFNPIHWSQEAAQAVGLPDVIAHGMLTMAMACQVVTDWLGDPGAVLSYGVRFTKPVVVEHGCPPNWR